MKKQPKYELCVAYWLPIGVILGYIYGVILAYLLPINFD